MSILDKIVASRNCSGVMRKRALALSFVGSPRRHRHRRPAACTTDAALLYERSSPASPMTPTVQSSVSSRWRLRVVLLGRHARPLAKPGGGGHAVVLGPICRRCSVASGPVQLAGIRGGRASICAGYVAATLNCDPLPCSPWAAGCSSRARRRCWEACFRWALREPRRLAGTTRRYRSDRCRAPL